MTWSVRPHRTVCPTRSVWLPSYAPIDPCPRRRSEPALGPTARAGTTAFHTPRAFQRCAPRRASSPRGRDIHWSGRSKDMGTRAYLHAGPIVLPIFCHTHARPATRCRAPQTAPLPRVRRPSCMCRPGSPQGPLPPPHYAPPDFPAHTRAPGHGLHRAANRSALAHLVAEILVK